MTFNPGEGFAPSGKRKSTLIFAKKRLKGAAPAVAFIVLTSVITSLFGIINPVMSRIFFDRLLSGHAPGWLNPFIAVLAALSVFQIITLWAKTVYNLKINGKMAIEGKASFMWKVLRLPMEFFSQRMASVVMDKWDEEHLEDERLIAKQAIDDILKYYRHKPVDIPENITDVSDQLEYVLRPTGLMVREVELEDNWQNDAYGPMLGYMKDLNATVALLPGKVYGYQDAETGLRRAGQDGLYACRHCPPPLHHPQL